MSEKIGIDEKPIIKYVGVFNMEELYKMLSSFLINRKYDFNEKKYKDKSGEIEFGWVAEKKITSYYKYEIQIKCHVWDYKKIDIEGQKLNRGRVEIKYLGAIIYDYNDQWTKTPFTRWLHKIYYLYVVKLWWAVYHYTAVYDEIYKLFDTTQDFFNMQKAINPGL